jgi:[acyl-carrier-protein] S-malonyltransferase
MSAVIGSSHALIEKICKKTDCQIANINSESQIVISGSDNSIFLATQMLKELGSKVIPLKVSGAFHSKLMSEAKPALLNAINTSTFNKPVCPVVSNYDGISRIDEDEIKNALIHQIDNPVLWLKSVNTLKEISLNFIEIGPKKVLGNIIKKIDDSLIITNYNCYSDL